MPAMRFVIRGIVQGVGFRYFVRSEAWGLDLGGWVRNRPDGSVEVLASGEEAGLRSLGAALRKGPYGSHVTAVDESPAEGDGTWPFEIRR